MLMCSINFVPAANTLFYAKRYMCIEAKYSASVCNKLCSPASHNSGGGFNFEGKAELMHVCVFGDKKQIVHPFLLLLGCIQEADPHTPQHTHTFSEHLLYILKHAVSLRSLKGKRLLPLKSSYTAHAFASIYG